MKINTKNKLKDLAGKEIDLTVGEAIGEILAASETGGKMKLFILAQKFYQSTEPIEVDKSDLELVKKTIEESKTYKPIVSGQLLVIIEDVK